MKAGDHPLAKRKKFAIMKIILGKKDKEKKLTPFGIFHKMEVGSTLSLACVGYGNE